MISSGPLIKPGTWNIPEHPGTSRNTKKKKKRRENKGENENKIRVNIFEKMKKNSYKK